MSNKMATALLSGNTNTDNRAKKKRIFQITLNYEQNPDIETSKSILLNKYDKIKSYLLSLKYNYIISCIEQNKKGFYHIHIFIQFTTPHRLSIKNLEGAHIEDCKGSVNQNLQYIKKDGNILDEFGTPRFILGNPHIKDIIKANYDEILEECDYRYYRVCKDIKKDNPPTFNTKKHLYLIYDINNLPESFNNYIFFNLYSKLKINSISFNIIIENKNIYIHTLNAILNKFNKPFKNIYPSYINNIILEIKNFDTSILDNYKNMISEITYLDNYNYENLIPIPIHPQALDENI